MSEVAEQPSLELASIKKRFSRHATPEDRQKMMAMKPKDRNKFVEEWNESVAKVKSVKKTITTTKVKSSEDVKESWYIPFPKLVESLGGLIDLEGATQAAGRMAGKQEQKGPPYVMFEPWTETIFYLFTKKGRRDGFLRSSSVGVSGELELSPEALEAAASEAEDSGLSGVIPPHLLRSNIASVSSPTSCTPCSSAPDTCEIADFRTPLQTRHAVFALSPHAPQSVSSDSVETQHDWHEWSGWSGWSYGNAAVNARDWSYDNADANARDWSYDDADATARDWSYDNADANARADRPPASIADKPTTIAPTPQQSSKGASMKQGSLAAFNFIPVKTEPGVKDEPWENPESNKKTKKVKSDDEKLFGEIQGLGKRFADSIDKAVEISAATTANTKLWGWAKPDAEQLSAAMAKHNPTLNTHKSQFQLSSFAYWQRQSKTDTEYVSLATHKARLIAGLDDIFPLVKKILKGQAVRLTDVALVSEAVPKAKKLKTTPNSDA
jgi:hypothetical protein